MELNKVLEELRRERAALDQAIAALENIGRRGGRGATGRTLRRRRRHLTPEGRRRLSEMMKKRWAERKRKARAA